MLYSSGGRRASVRARSASAHPGHVSSGAESRPGAGDHDASDAGIPLDHEQHLAQRGGELSGQGVALLWPIQREGGDALLDGAEQLVGSGVDGLHVRSPSSRSLASR